MTEQSVIKKAFYICTEQMGALSKILISGMGSKDMAFYNFYEAFHVLYMLTINNTKLRDIDYGDNTNLKLVDKIQEWFDTARNHSDSESGINLFKEFNIALGRVGLL